MKESEHNPFYQEIVEALKEGNLPCFSQAESSNSVGIKFSPIEIELSFTTNKIFKEYLDALSEFVTELYEPTTMSRSYSC